MLSFNCSRSMYVYCLKNKYCILFGHAVRPSIIEARKVVKIKDESDSSANASGRLMLLPLQARILFILVVDDKNRTLFVISLAVTSSGNTAASPFPASKLASSVTENVLSLEAGEDEVAEVGDANDTTYRENDSHEQGEDDFERRQTKLKSNPEYDDDWLGSRNSTSKKSGKR
uniref:Uncharacterized protein n=1 Tax=Glossina austeni TaxID=7395 RepID=A0A1A9V966_GLOAU